MIKNKYWQNAKLSTKFNIIYLILLAVILAITMGGSVLGVWFCFKLGIDDEEEFMEVLVKVMGWTFIIGLGLISIFGSKVSKKLLKPLDEITKAEEEISAENLDKRINYTGSNDELKVLADSFDKMIERLENSFNKQNEFISDVSHELKTPIAVILGYSNLLERWGKDDKETLDKSIKAIQEETDNMKDLVNKLLLLTKTDTGNFPVTKTVINLKELIEDITEETKLIENSREIVNSSNEELKIYADIGNVKEVIRILIDNAIHYTESNGKIDIYTKDEKNKVYICVEDNGIGIPKDEQDKIFDRFYRIDKSRNKETGGNGLGLSIAKSLIKVNGGEIKVESREKEYTKFIIMFEKYKGQK